MAAWLVGGFLGGAAGALIWVIVGYLTHYEIGWIAWGVGFLTGAGVRYASYLRDEEESTLQGIVAAVIALGSILVAKYVVFVAVVGGVAAELRSTVAHMEIDNEMLIAGIANEVVEEKTERGEEIEWPEGMSVDDAVQESDYPPNIWQEAEKRWNKLAPAEQEERKKLYKETLSVAAAAAIGNPAFSECFSPLDLLWFGLALVTAYKIGVGTYNTE